jgi:hypothetical protein
MRGFHAADAARAKSALFFQIIAMAWLSTDYGKNRTPERPGRH